MKKNNSSKSLPKDLRITNEKSSKESSLKTSESLGSFRGVLISEKETITPPNNWKTAPYEEIYETNNPNEV